MRETDESADALWERLRERLEPSNDWSDLLGSQYEAQRIRRCLTQRLSDVQMQLSQRREEATAFQHECFGMREGKERWFEFKKEYTGWRSRTLHFSRLLNARIAETRDAEQQKGRGKQVEESTMLRAALRQLSVGVFDHERTVRRLSDPGSEDEFLWRLLDDIQMPSIHGLVSLRSVVVGGWVRD